MIAQAKERCGVGVKRIVHNAGDHRKNCWQTIFEYSNRHFVIARCFVGGEALDNRFNILI